jgi:hypothetical protein
LDEKCKLAEILGPENVLDAPDILDAYSRDESFVSPVRPRFVVRPDNTEKVQKLVRWARRSHVPLVPVSSGPPHFNGDTVPGSSEAVIVDLSRMDRILRIDRKNRMTLVEPGVSFSRLQPSLANQGLRISTPLLPRGNKSVIASLLERQPTLVPKYNWSLPEPLRCLEIVWGTGDILWTGEAGSQPHSLEKQWQAGQAQINAMGPQETDWHRLVSGAQGSLGIVTWASIRCEILPSVHHLLLIPAGKLSDLIDCAYQLIRVRVGDEVLILNSASLAYILGKGTDEIKLLREKLPPWMILIGIAGRDILPEEKVRVGEEDIRDIAGRFGLSPVSDLPEVNDYHVMDTLLQVSGDPYWKLVYRGGCQSILFLTTLDKTPGFVNSISTLAGSVNYPAADIGVYIQPQHQGAAYHCEFMLPYGPSSRTAVSVTRNLFAQSSKELSELGAFFSRPYGSWSDLVYSRDITAGDMLKKIKNIFDPDHILNPGKLCFQVEKKSGR